MGFFLENTNHLLWLWSLNLRSWSSAAFRWLLTFCNLWCDDGQCVFVFEPLAGFTCGWNTAVLKGVCELEKLSEVQYFWPIALSLCVAPDESRSYEQAQSTVRKLYSESCVHHFTEMAKKGRWSLLEQLFPFFHNSCQIVSHHTRNSSEIDQNQSPSKCHFLSNILIQMFLLKYIPRGSNAFIEHFMYNLWCFILVAQPWTSISSFLRSFSGFQHPDVVE